MKLPAMKSDVASILHNTKSLIFCDPFQPPIFSTDRPPSPQITYPKFLDIDNPDPIAKALKNSLSYGDALPSKGPLKEALFPSKEASDQRAAEAERVFRPVASFLNQH